MAGLKNCKVIKHLNVCGNLFKSMEKLSRGANNPVKYNYRKRPFIPIRIG